MQIFEKASAREAALFRKLARSLFIAKTETDVADALLSAVCEVTPRGGAVYLETERGFRRLAATGTGLTLPAETDRLQRAALTVHRHGGCALVHDRLDQPSEELLDAESVTIVNDGACAAPDLCVQLPLDGTVVGVLVARPRVSGQLGLEQQRTLERIAPQLAVAIALARRLSER